MKDFLVAALLRDLLKVVLCVAAGTAVIIIGFAWMFNYIVGGGK